MKVVQFIVEDADGDLIEKAKDGLTWKQFTIEISKAINEKRVKGWPPKIRKVKKE